MTADEIDEMLKVVKEVAEYITDFCPSPGPYHPKVTALLELADKIRFVPRGPGV